MKRLYWLTLIFPLALIGCSKTYNNPTEYKVEYITACALAGRILPTGISATVTVTQGATVKAAACNAQGLYQIDSLSAGSCILEVKASSYGTTRTTVTLIAGGINNIGDITVQKLPYPVSGVSPAYNSEWNGLSTSIGISFSRQMDQASVEAAFHITPAINGYFVWSNNYTYLNFRPLSYLITDTAYTIRLDSTAHTVDNTNLEFSMVSSFRTEPFRVTQTSPATGTSGYGMQNTVYIYFTSYSNPNYTSVENAIQITPAIPSGIDYTWNGYYVYLRPKSGYWKSNSQHTVIIPTTAQDNWGHYVFMPCTTVFYTQPAKVTYYQPANGQTGVSLNPNINFQFNTMMDYTSLMSALTVRDTLDSVATIGSSNWYGYYGYFYFSPQLKPTMRYTVLLDSTAADLYGSKMPLPVTFTFTTGN